MPPKETKIENTFADAAEHVEGYEVDDYSDLDLTPSQRKIFDHLSQRPEPKILETPRPVVSVFGLETPDGRFSFDEEFQSVIHDEIISNWDEEASEEFEALQDDLNQTIYEGLRKTTKEKYSKESDQELEEYRSRFSHNIKKIKSKELGKPYATILKIANEEFNDFLIRNGKMKKEDLEFFDDFGKPIEKSTRIEKYKDYLVNDIENPNSAKVKKILLAFRQLKDASCVYYRKKYKEEHPNDEFFSTKTTSRTDYWMRYFVPHLKNESIIKHGNQKEIFSEEMQKLGISQEKIDKVYKSLLKDCRRYYVDLVPVHSEEFVYWNEPTDSILHEREIRKKYEKRLESDLEGQSEGFLKKIAADIIKEEKSDKLKDLKLDEIDDAILLPTGFILKAQGKIFTKAISPLDEKVMKNIPEEMKTGWTKTWIKAYERNGSIEESESSQQHSRTKLSNYFTKNVRKKISEDLNEAADEEREYIRKRYSINYFFDKETGELNDDITDEDIELIRGIPSEILSYIDKISTFSKRTDLNDINKSLSNFYSGRRGPSSSICTSMDGEINLYVRNLESLIDKDNEDIPNKFVKSIANCIYGKMSENQIQEFISITRSELNVSEQEFYSIHGRRISSNSERSRIASRTVFTEKFAQYLRGELPDERLNELFDSLKSKKYKESSHSLVKRV